MMAEEGNYSIEELYKAEGALAMMEATDQIIDDAVEHLELALKLLDSPANVSGAKVCIQNAIKNLKPEEEE